MAKSEAGKKDTARRRSSGSARPRKATGGSASAAPRTASPKTAPRRTSAAKKPAAAPKQPVVKAPEPKKAPRRAVAPATGADAKRAGKAALKSGAATPAVRVEEIKALIALGKKKGYLTYDEIMSQLPEDESSPERFDEIFRALGEMAIEVVDAPERRKATDGEEAADEESSPEAELDLSPAPVGRTDDPVRMYLREMGRTPLLTREGEIRIAKRIEEGRRDFSGIKVLHLAAMGALEDNSVITAHRKYHNRSG